MRGDRGLRGLKTNTGVSPLAFGSVEMTWLELARESQAR